jgi:uncharacterized membrane protein YesL
LDSTIDSKLYRATQLFVNLFLLNLLWLLVCIPIVTIFPATAALFGVIRSWVTKKDTRVWKPFFQTFKEHLKQHFIFGSIWILLGGLFILDFRLIQNLSEGIQFPLFIFLVFIVILYLFTSIFLFPTMVHFQQQGWLELVKNSLLLSVSHLFITVGCLLAMFGLIVLALSFPFLLLIVASLISYIVFTLCNFSFRKMEAK